MYILGTGGFSHDSAACLIKDGQMIAAAAEERFTRRKHEGGVPRKAIDYCLNKAGITMDEVEHIGAYMKPSLRLRKRLPYRVTQIPKSLRYSAAYFLYEIYHNTEYILGFNRLRGKNTKLHFLEHHVAHAASAFLVSTFEEAALLSLDYIGEWAATFMGVGRGSEFKKIKEINYPQSLGVFYSAITDYLGFQRANDEYKVMGLASYGDLKYYDEFKKIIKLKSGGEYEIDLSYFVYHYKPGSQFGYMSQKFYNCFGARRKKDEPIEQRYMDIAAGAQKILEDVVLHISEYLHEATGLKDLCIAGGVGLNSVMNGRLRRESPFERIFIQPAAGDDGIAVGAAYYIYNTILGYPRNFELKHAYWGPQFSNEEIKTELDLCKLPYQYYDDIPRVCAQLLAEGKIVGWFQGRMEWGPRALGNRSILADPRRADMKDILNKYVKHREDFRPFAPSVPLQDAPRFFNKGENSPYMLFVFDVLKEKQSEIPATTHVDGTGRVQTVEEPTNPYYYRVIKEFEKLTGVPVILNTSFNVRGEPIVCTPKEAIRCFYSTGLDYLIMGNFLISKSLNEI